MGKKSCGRKSPWEYLCSLSVKLTAENTANLFSGLYLNSRICSNKISCFFFYYFLFTAGFFPHGENTLWGFTPMGYVKLLKIT